MESPLSIVAERVTLQDGRLLVPVGAISGGIGYRGMDGMAVIVSVDDGPHGRLLHLSVSYKQRDPTWHDLRMLRLAFFPPTVDVLQLLPRAENYRNIHQHCFHLFQCPEPWEGGWNV